MKRTIKVTPQQFGTLYHYAEQTKTLPKDKKGNLITMSILMEFSKEIYGIYSKLKRKKITSPTIDVRLSYHVMATIYPLISEVEGKGNVREEIQDLLLKIKKTLK